MVIALTVVCNSVLCARFETLYDFNAHRMTSLVENIMHITLCAVFKGAELMGTFLDFN